MRGAWFVLLAACQMDVVRDHAVVDPVSPPPQPAPAPAPARPRDPIEMLASASFGEVLQSKRLLLGDRAGSLSRLVVMVDRDERVPLENTADLIWPGAKQFYGHGWVVNYDLDALADRAGWVLEEATFHDFRFSDGVHGEMRIDPAKNVARLARARAAVHAWWNTLHRSWNCYAALVDEMHGPKPWLAYAWLSAWRAMPCEGFTAAGFRTDLLPLVRAHARDPKHPMHDYAVELLDDLDARLEKLVTLSGPG